MRALILCLAILTITTTAQAKTLIASWYSVESLKAEGTYKYSKGVMANGKQFTECSISKYNGLEVFVCATSKQYKLGTYLKVTNNANGKSILAKVTDRIGKRFKGKRIDLSKGAFSKIADTKQGIVSVEVTELR